MGRWQLVTGTYYSATMPVRSSATDQVKVLIYTDSAIGSAGILGAQNSSGTTVSPIYVARSADSVRYFNGAIDELIIAKVQRSADWVRLSYFTQKPGATVVALGASQGNGPSNLSYLANPANYVVNNMITPNTATVTGVVDSFTVSPALPAGLALNKTTGTISGTPTLATATAKYAVTAANAAGSVTDSVTITVASGLPAAPTIAYSPVNLPLTVGSAIVTPVSPTLGGGAVDSVTVSPALPAGLSLDKATGAITGTPTVAAASAAYVFTARNLGGFGRDTINITVLPVAPSNLVYPVQSATYTVADAIAPNVPTVSGGAVDSFTVAPALPTGFVFNKTTGGISGTAAASATTTSYVVTAVNAGGSAKDTLTFTVNAGEVYSTWARHRSIRLNTSATGANVAGNVMNFPVLVRFTAADSTVLNSIGRGADLRFTKTGDVVRLPHQIETWDSTGRTASVWVLVDTVKGNNSTQMINVHVGKAGALNRSSGNAVFDTTRGFEAVWHFGESLAADTARDATANNFSATPLSTAGVPAPGDTAGAVGRARYFGTGAGTGNATGGYYLVPNSATGALDFPTNGTYTLSSWVYADMVGTSRTMYSKSDKQYSMELRNTGADWEFANFAGASGWQVVNQAAAVAATWVHLVGVRNGTTSLLYVDGVMIDSVTRLDASTAARRQVNFEIGRSPDGGTSNASRYYWRGMLDEIRLASVARSADWVKLEFENQKAVQSLVSFTGVVGIHGVVARTAGMASLAVKALPSGMAFRVQGVEVGSARLSLVDMSGRAVWNGAFAAGANNLVWNGLDNSGHAVPTGVYTARVTIKDASEKVTVFNARVPYMR